MSGNKRGPSIDPCDTPGVILCGDETFFWIETFLRSINLRGRIQTRRQMQDYNLYNLNCLLAINMVVVVVNHCFTSLFGTKGILIDIVIRLKRCSQLMR